MKKRKKTTCPLTPAWSSIPTAAYFRQGCLWLPFSQTQLGDLFRSLCFQESSLKVPARDCEMPHVPFLFWPQPEPTSVSSKRGLRARGVGQPQGAGVCVCKCVTGELRWKKCPSAWCLLKVSQSNDPRWQGLMERNRVMGRGRDFGRGVVREGSLSRSHLNRCLKMRRSQPCGCLGTGHSRQEALLCKGPEVGMSLARPAPLGRRRLRGEGVKVREQERASAWSPRGLGLC